jgi:nucleotide-binding universal stress UspA family protein
MRQVSIRKILLPVTFSERCRGAASYAAAIACQFRSQITVFHALESAAIATRGFEGVALPDEWYVEQRAFKQKRLETFKDEELPSSGAQCVVAEGDPAREIVRCAQEGGMDLIVMPTHGYGPFRRFLLGSVTAKVLHDAACPVLTGPHMEQAPPVDAIGFAKLLCAIDLGPRSGAVLEWAAGFAASYGASLSVLYAVPFTEIRVGAMYFDADWRAEKVSAARASIAELCRETGVTAAVEIHFGDPPGAVYDVASSLGANLVVIGRSVAPGIAGRLRAVGYEIVREAPCAVASV